MQKKAFQILTELNVAGANVSARRAGDAELIFNSLARPTIIAGGGWSDDVVSC